MKRHSVFPPSEEFYPDFYWLCGEIQSGG